jgi:FMN phosphatase YigB (HAD superfamily)
MQGQNERSDAEVKIPSGVSFDGQTTFSHVALHGSVYEQELNQLLRDVAAHGISECIESGVLVRTSSPSGHTLSLPRFAISSQLCTRRLTDTDLVARTGLHRGQVRRWLSELGEDIDRRDTYGMSAHRYDLIIFDWSNTLATETPLDEAICDEIAEVAGRFELKRLLHDLEKQYDYRWYDYLYLGGVFGLSHTQILELHTRHRREIGWVEGAKDLLDYCRGATRCALATNCASSVLGKRMELLDVPKGTFDAIVTSSDTRDIRSKVKHIEIILAKYDVPSARALMISDSFDCDILPAISLGLNAIWLMRPTERSFWGSPGIDAQKDQYALSIGQARHLPNLIVTSHNQTLNWLRGTP